MTMTKSCFTNPRESKIEVDMDELSRIREDIMTQDNACTAHPIFVVQKRRRTYGFDPDYCDHYVYIDEEGNEADQVEFEDIEENGTPDNWTKTAFQDTWEFVTACFTRRGAERYIALNGHNLTDPRIYVDSGHRNEEWIFLRKYLSNTPVQES